MKYKQKKVYLMMMKNFFVKKQENGEKLYFPENVQACGVF